MATSIKVSLAASGRIRGDRLVLGVFEGEHPDWGRLSDSLAATIRRGLASYRGWRGKHGQVAELSGDGEEAAQIRVYGLGSRTNFNVRLLCKWGLEAALSAQRGRIAKLALLVPRFEGGDTTATAMALARELALSAYRFDRFVSTPPSSSLRLISLYPQAEEVAVYRKGLRLMRPVASGVELCRDLANTPPNEANPVWMAEQARKLADDFGMKALVLTPAGMARRKMGAILAVGAGSANASRMVRLEWGRGKRLISFVGKGVTFDSGGISLKPGLAMDEMKYDKGGACTVLGIARAVAEMKLPGRFRAYLPLAENMPDGASYRPSDIIRCFNGKTVEVLNTDAEGRMLLADAMAWAAADHPDVMLEYSTLTGATVVALGQHGAALYSPSDRLADELLEAARESGEYLWRMPLWPEFVEEMKGNHADLKNLGSRWGGGNSAAAFLSHFTEGAASWAHLDIAGTAYRTDEQNGQKGATGHAVALTTTWLLRYLGRL